MIQAGKKPADEELLRRLASHASFHKAQIAQAQGATGEAEKQRTRGNQLMGFEQ